LSCIYAPKFKTAVQVDNEKDWGYNDIGLLDQVFYSYLMFQDKLNKEQIAELLVHFIRMHSYRLQIQVSKPGLLIKYFRKLSHLVPGNQIFTGKLALLLFKEYLLKMIK